MSLGVLLPGGNPAPRHKDDFYATPPEATLALVLEVGHLIGSVVHEPCCGAGDMASVLVLCGYQVVATDLVDRGYGLSGIDYLQDRNRAPALITNPPYKLAKQFIQHALDQEPAFCAMLLKSTFWNAAGRLALHERFPPKMTLPLTWRLDWTGGGSPILECTWFVWGSAVPGPSAPKPLRRPSLGVFA